MKPLAMVFLGAPGAGKGTYCKELTLRYGAPHVSTGDMFRMAVQEGHAVGLRAKEYMDRGVLVPDEVVLGVVLDRLEHPDCRTNGIILDGFPRTPAQAEALPGLLAKIGLELDLAVNLVVGHDILVRRLTGRRLCRSCPRGNFNIYTLPPKKPGICDYCGGELYQRSDDRLEVIENRLEAYERDTKPIIATYRSRGLLHDEPVGVADIPTTLGVILAHIGQARQAHAVGRA